MSLLQLQNVSIGYHLKKQPKIVQQNLNLAVNAGEFVALIGKNGCGKSTLLRSMACLQPILDGKIRVNGENLFRMSSKQRAHLLSIVLSDKQLAADFTVKELIAIGRDPYTGWLGKLTENDEQIIRQAIEMTNLQEFENRNVNKLSDGERQRVFIARALAQDTPIILLDEPTSHLDLPNRVSILLLLQKLARETNKTIFISTHELETALQVADKMWIMEKLNGVRVGTPEDLVLQGVFDQVFAHNTFVFDKEYGSFMIKKNLDKLVNTQLIGSAGVMTRWTTRALTRKGYRISADAQTTIRIDENTKSWTVQSKNLTQKADTIGDVLEILQSI